MPIRAVGFDIDGTLYPAGALYLRMIPAMTGSLRLLMAFSHTRKALREPNRDSPFRDAPPTSLDAFHRYQAGMVADMLGRDPHATHEAISRIFYRRSAEQFSRIAMFRGVVDALTSFRAAGLKLGVLSDFPCERKLELLGIADRFDAAITSETTGLVKPDPASFRLLASMLGVQPGEMVYVGNSESYDVRGAKAAGMLSAFISTSARARRKSRADFAFGDYRELAAWVLSIKES